MTRRRLIQFMLEVVFLGGLAALAAVARMRPEAVIAVMAFGWVVVALVEWASWLDRPHFGRGLPPRYYLPQVSLPPPQPLPRAPLPSGPARRLGEEAQTWIASPDWVEALGEWPAVDLERLGADLGGVQPVAAAADTEIAAPPADAPAAAEPVWTEILPPPPPLPPSAGADAVLPHAEAAGEPGAGDEPTDESLLALPVPAGRTGPPVRHRIDPFAPSAGGRLRRRREPGGVVELPDGPPPGRPAPLALRASRGSGRR